MKSMTLGPARLRSAKPRVNSDEPASRSAPGKLPPGSHSSSPKPTRNPASQLASRMPRLTAGWLASRASRRSQLRTRRAAGPYTWSTSRSTILMNPTRPRGMTRVTATFTHTATTIRAPRTAAAMRTPPMLEACGPPGPATPLAGLAAGRVLS